MSPATPAGSTSAAAHQYYEYLYGQYYMNIPAERTTILWSGPAYVAIWGIVLIGFFFLFAWSFQRVHRTHGELYGVSSFAGSILERIGPASKLTIAVWIAVTLWSLFYAIIQCVHGYIY
ncbi:MAG: hypothetical protein M3Z30_08245 [Gemmatimonadota bacterium]|nr:hypothetical protein [Gemmatimonadota bacterium]